MQATQPTSQQVLADLSRKPATEAVSKIDAQQSRFLTLLTTQLKNQDPLNPTDSAQTTSQLAQISTVDGIERLNKTLSDMASLYKSSESLQAAVLVGRQVLVDGKDLRLQEGLGLAGIELAEPADQVSVKVYDSNGLEVDRRDLGPMPAGSQMFVWDGVTSNGSQAVDGNYTFKVSATRGNDDVSATGLQMATVSSVLLGGEQISIDLGKYGKVAMDAIKRIL